MELKRTTFRRLLQFHLVLLPVFLVVGLAEGYFERWSGFSDTYDRFVVDHFRATPADTLTGAPLLIVLGLLVAAVVWSVAAAIGLLLFRRSARWVRGCRRCC